MEDFFSISLPVIAVFATPIIILWLCLRAKKDKLKSRLIEKAIEMNKEINPELFIEPKKDAETIKRQLLIIGITLISLGLALFGILLPHEEPMFVFSFLLLFPGIGLLVVRWLIARDVKKQN